MCQAPFLVLDPSVKHNRQSIISPSPPLPPQGMFYESRFLASVAGRMKLPLAEMEKIMTGTGLGKGVGEVQSSSCNMLRLLIKNPTNTLLTVRQFALSFT